MKITHNCQCGQEMTTGAEMCADCLWEGCTTEIHDDFQCIILGQRLKEDLNRNWDEWFENTKKVATADDFEKEMREFNAGR